MTRNEDVITEQSPAREYPGPRYLNVAAFKQDYPGLVHTCGFEGLGFAARQQTHGGRVLATAMTLDELATVIDSAQNRASR